MKALSVFIYMLLFSRSDEHAKCLEGAQLFSKTVTTEVKYIFWNVACFKLCKYYLLVHSSTYSIRILKVR